MVMGLRNTQCIRKFVLLVWNSTPIVLILLPLPTSATEKPQFTYTILTIYKLLDPSFFFNFYTPEGGGILCGYIQRIWCIVRVISLPAGHLECAAPQLVYPGSYEKRRHIWGVLLVRVFSLLPSPIVRLHHSNDDSH